MPLIVPTQQSLIQRALSDFETRVPGTDAHLYARFLNTFARTHAGAISGLYGYLDWLARQLMVDTAEAEWLDRHAAEWGVLRKSGTFATGAADFSGTEGTVIPAGLIMRRSDGAEYETTASGAVSNGSASVAVIATQSGITANTDGGAPLVITTPISGLNSSPVVGADGISGGEASESDDALRARVLARVRRPPHGGADYDYEAWALEVPGVTRAWVFPHAYQEGTVTIRIVNDNGVESITPAAETITAAWAHIDARRPVTSTTYVLAPTLVALDFTLSVTPNTTAVKAAVEAELRDMLEREAEPSGTIYLTHIHEAISLAAGETNHVIHSPTDNLIYEDGRMPVFGAITWQ